MGGLEIVATRIANLLGVLSALVVVLFWALLLTPTDSHWHVRFRGGLALEVITLAALLAAIFACTRGSRWWLIGLIASLLTTMLVFFGRV